MRGRALNPLTMPRRGPGVLHPDEGRKRSNVLEMDPDARASLKRYISPEDSVLLSARSIVFTQTHTNGKTRLSVTAGASRHILIVENDYGHSTVALDSGTIAEMVEEFVSVDPQVTPRIVRTDGENRFEMSHLMSHEYHLCVYTPEDSGRATILSPRSLEAFKRWDQAWQ